MIVRTGVKPKLGVLDFHPIQYYVPLYQLLTRRGNLELDVLYLSDRGYRPAMDPGFGIDVSWDIDLLSGYKHRFLPPALSAKRSAQFRALREWIKGHDAIVIYGYVNPMMLMGMAACRSLRTPYLLRGDSLPKGRATGIRRAVREAVARSAVAASAGCLAIGQLNELFYRSRGANRVAFAPYSVDDKRFAELPEIGRLEMLERWGLDVDKPVILFCGKLIPRKRPLDLAAAINQLPHDVVTIFVGDGPLAEEVRSSLRPGRGVVTGFINQAELPSYYHVADILVLPSESEPWGLVVNEAMAAGALPVVSDRVGCGPDLARGIGEVFPCGDVMALSAALARAVAKIQDADTPERVRQRVTGYSLERTALGFEEMAHEVRPQN